MTLKLFRSTKGYKADNYHDLSIYNDMTFNKHYYMFREIEESSWTLS